MAVLGAPRSYGSSNASTKFAAQWDNEWICIDSLRTANLTPYNHCGGFYSNGLCDVRLQ